MKIYQDEHSIHLLTSPTINPYWDEVKELEGDTFWGSWRPSFTGITSAGSMYALRSKLVKKYAWAIPDPETLRFVVKHAGVGIVEIGAGMGYWKWQLEQYGIPFVAYDAAPPDRMKNHYCGEVAYGLNNDGDVVEIPITLWSSVDYGTAEMAAKHPDRTLFLCWPPYEDGMAYDALKSYTGWKLIYIGEGAGGCTGDDAFHELLAECWEEVDSHSIVQWEGIHDYVYVYIRKEKNVLY